MKKFQLLLLHIASYISAESHHLSEFLEIPLGLTIVLRYTSELVTKLY